MKYCTQFVIIMGFTMAGEILQRMIPLPIPASVYGLVLLLLALTFRLVKVEQVKTVGGFLTSIFPILFVSPTVSIIDDWVLIREDLLPVFLVLIFSTVLAFAVGGRVTQKVREGGYSHG